MPKIISGTKMHICERVNYFLFVSILLLLWLCLNAQAPATQMQAGGIADPRLDARVESLLRKMTLEERIGQLVQYSAGQQTGPGTGRTDYEDMIAKGQIGALFNISTAKETNAYQHIAVEKIAPAHSACFRAGRHSWLPHRISNSFRLGLDMGSGAGRESGPSSRAGGIGDWNSLDVLSDGGHCPRRTL